MAEGFTVLSTGQEPRQGANGAPAEVMAATFVTVPPGGTGYVAVPKNAGWKDALLAAVEQQAAELRAAIDGSRYIVSVGVTQELGPDFVYRPLAEARVVVPDGGELTVSAPLAPGWPAELAAQANAAAADLLDVLGA